MAIPAVTFNDVLDRLSEMDPSIVKKETIIETMSPIIGQQQVIELLKCFDSNLASEESEDNKIELITVMMIMKISNELTSIGKSTITIDSYKTAHTLMTSVLGLFKYHFQLPVNHKNFAFRNFGHLIATEETNIFSPFLQILDLDPPFEHVRIDKFEKIFILLTILHLFSKSLCPALLSFLATDSVNEKLARVFKFDNQKINKTEFPLVTDIYKRFKFTLQLEESTFINDFKFDSLLNTIFFTSFHKIGMQKYLESFLSYKSIQDNMLDESLIQLALDSIQFSYHPMVITLTCYHHPKYIEVLQGVINDKSKNQTVKDASMFLLLNVVDTLYSNSDIFSIDDDPIIKSAIWEFCSSNTHKILGVNNSKKFKYSLQKETLLPLFELRDQNVKLKYDNEIVFLNNLKTSLMNINLNIDSSDGFLILNNLLIDTGCSISVGSFFDSIQIIIISIIQNLKFKNNQHFCSLPPTYINSLGLNFIPPVNREDSSFESMYDIHLKNNNFGSFFKLLIETQHSKGNQLKQAIYILEQCLIYIVTIKFKIFQYLLKLNNDTNVLRVLSPFEEEKLEEYQIYKFKNPITKIGMFRSGKSLDYKLLTPAVELNIISSLSLLILSENYKILKNYQNIQDSSLSRFFNEFVVSSISQFILIYQEFGILIMFKMIRTLNELNLNLILPTATVISKIFPIRKIEPTEIIDNEEVGTLDSSINEILSQSIISSNLVRQFVELFDDGQSKPFKALNKFLKNYPSTLKPSKIPKGTVKLNVQEFLNLIC